MINPKIGDEIKNVVAEPLLPIERKLIGWSLGIGIALLVILAVVNHYVPIPG